MNWDLVIGLIIGLSGSLIGLVGAIVTNRQNHKQELKIIQKTHEQELEIIKKNHEREMELNQLLKSSEEKIEKRRIILENSFKDFEISRQLSNANQEPGEFPYDMYLLMYSKVAEYLDSEDHEKNYLAELLGDISQIRETYQAYLKNQKLRDLRE